MSEMGVVKHLLDAYLAIAEAGSRIAVPTHCLYPSNSSVTVYVTGGALEIRVSDEGGAIDEISAHGLKVEDADRLLHPFCKRAGLRHDKGAIYSPSVPIERLPSMVVLVANASSAAAKAGLDKFKIRLRRDLKEELRRVLQLRFSEERIHSHSVLTGQSTRQYHFDNVVDIGSKKRLVMDAVLPDAASINAKAVAHLDLKQVDDSTIIQRIVYDDQDKWASADLNLLQTVATIVPFSAIDRQLDRIGAA
ncbi:MAG: hypothetical protein RID42_01715 [Alphaproteobacteria bacterium]